MAKVTFTAKDIEDNKLLAALSYLWILSIVFLLVKKDSPFVQFHAKQGLILCIASIILWLIPFIGWILNIVVFILIVVGFFQALSGKDYRIPGVAQIAEKINF